MLTFSEAQLLEWVSPVLWPFLRVLALFGAMPVLSQRTVPARLRVALAFLIAVCAQASLPPMPVVALDSVAAGLLVVQQLLVGLTLGFAVRIVFAAVELAGELVGLQMGLNFAGFFDPSSGGQGTATGRFYGTSVAWLFIVINGHLLMVAAVVQSFQAFPVGPEPFAFLRAVQPQQLGAEIFRLGLWIALPVVSMLLFTNLVLGVVARVAQQLQIFAIGFPITVTVGLLGMLATLPLMATPFEAALERMLTLFQ
ncbi:flagellar biosynthetic protein FliR [Piscinibacter sakaiensis]|uniref:Flagellar biosynthetic protein FliR n=1 Tax=Piscinibacter sakaiensis TaxID=1547922 RepID=A0A0K8P6K6_PISS1|nr:flagellar biosynthetic protein FliR [Piscinibacter sakaiensis]GAP38237.1 flagellar biosynthesis protein FliR [Piscinibacter sakaiensis]